MKKIFKRIFVITFAIIFAFSPLFFAGCDTSGIGKNKNTTSQNNTGNNSGSSNNNNDDSNNYDDIDDIDDIDDVQRPSVNVSDYLGGIKVSYIASSTAAEDPGQIAYQNDIVVSSQFMASDILMNLYQMYGYGLNGISPTIVSSDNTITKQLSAYETPFSMEIDGTFTYNGVKYVFTKSRTDYTRSVIFGDGLTRNTWKFLDISYIEDEIEYASFVSDKRSMIQLLTGLPYNETTNTLQLSSSAQSNVNKLAYIILLIKQKFENVSESTFDATYNSLKNEYASIENNTSIDYYKKLQQLALSTNYNGIISGSLEEKALKQFILDFVIGSNLVANDQTKFKIFEYGNYNTPDMGTEFSGEYIYYNELAEYPLNPTDPYDISLYIHGSAAMNNVDHTAVKSKVEDIYQNTENHYKFWQDADGDGQIDIEMITYNNKLVPKYRAERSFRNYKYTVGVIVDKVLTGTESMIKKNNEDTGYETSYPTVSNVYSRNYNYSGVECNSALSSSNTCKLDRMAYKGFVLCLKEKEHNNLGEITMVMESAQGVSVSVDLYLRYYRKNASTNQFATWQDTDSMFERLKTESGQPLTVNINGPYGLKVNPQTGKMEDSSFSIDLQKVLSKAYFGTGEDKTLNNQSFSHNGKSIFEVKLFPTDFYKTMGAVGHTNIFSLDPKNNPNYDVFGCPDGSNKKIYAYSESNLKDCEAEEFEFVEILFVASNNNPFTFGFLGYIPATESYGN